MKKSPITFIFIISIFALFTTCKKDFETPTGGNKIEFNNITVDSVSYFRVQLTTQFINTGGNEIPQHGYCWSTAGNPTLENYLDFTENGSGLGIFTGSLTGFRRYYIFCKCVCN